MKLLIPFLLIGFILAGCPISTTTTSMIARPPTPVLEVVADGSDIVFKVTAAYVKDTMFFVSFDKFTSNDLTGTPGKCENRIASLAQSTANQEWMNRFASSDDTTDLPENSFAYPGGLNSNTWARESASCHQVRYIMRTTLAKINSQCANELSNPPIEYRSTTSDTNLYTGNINVAYIYPKSDQKASGFSQIAYSLGFSVRTSPETGEIKTAIAEPGIETPTIVTNLTTAGRVLGSIKFDKNTKSICNPSFTVQAQEINFDAVQCAQDYLCDPKPSTQTFTFKTEDRYLTLGGQASQVSFTKFDCDSPDNMVGTINGIRYNISFIDTTSTQVATDNSNDPYLRAARKGDRLVIALSTQLGKHLAIDDFRICRGKSGDRTSVIDSSCDSSNKVENLLTQRGASNIYEIYGPNLPDAGIVWAKAGEKSTILVYDLNKIAKIENYSEFEISGMTGGDSGNGDQDTGDSFAAYSLGVGAVIAGIAMMV